MHTHIHTENYDVHNSEKIQYSHNNTYKLTMLTYIYTHTHLYNFYTLYTHFKLFIQFIFFST